MKNKIIELLELEKQKEQIEPTFFRSDAICPAVEEKYEQYVGKKFGISVRFSAQGDVAVIVTKNV